MAKKNLLKEKYGNPILGEQKEFESNPKFHKMCEAFEKGEFQKAEKLSNLMTQEESGRIVGSS